MIPFSFCHSLLAPPPPSAPPSVCSTVFEAEGRHVKLLSEHFDRLHSLLLQFADFLQLALSPATAYAAFLPPLPDLVNRYHMAIEVEGGGKLQVMFATSSPRSMPMFMLSCRFIVGLISASCCPASPQVAFHLYRPVLRLFCPPEHPDVCWPELPATAAAPSAVSVKASAASADLPQHESGAGSEAASGDGTDGEELQLLLPSESGPQQVLE